MAQAISGEQINPVQPDEHQSSEVETHFVIEEPNLDELHLRQDGVHADAQLTSDGRLDITVDGNQETLDRLLKPLLNNKRQDDPPPQSNVQFAPMPNNLSPTKLNIVIQIIGSRGDVQPFIALGKVLQKHGHRIRIATHPTFKNFVEDNGLEFFSIGGDPAQLMAFMIKNPGLLPGFDSLRAGDVGKRRKDMAEIIDGCWRSCVDPVDNTNGRSSEDIMTDASRFVADAIIANPPSFAHIHCAEKLRIPLHLMFTMPWSPTTDFSHPLANIKVSNVDPKVVNYLSYALVETMTWQGLGDMVNSFRVKRLGLSEIDPTFAPGMTTALKIPYNYAWSPALIPKPKDWDHHISISGFMFLSLATAYKPPDDLARFLDAGPPPVYIGFGSIVVDDPDGLTVLILKAVKTAGIRALISKGWGGLGSDKAANPENVFMLGNCPHDWLFPRTSCVVHHGGAGTMAAGIAAGKPTVIVPFFGDQPFWGDMIARAGAGPAPIPYKKLTAENLATAIAQALQPATTERAVDLGSSINKERGTEVAANNFYSQLPLSKMYCLVSPDRIAVWRFSKSTIQLSAMGAALLSKEGLLDFDELKLYGPCDHRTDYGAVDPLSATVKVSYRLFSDLISGFTYVSRGMYERFETTHETHSTATGEVGNLSGPETASKDDRKVLNQSSDVGVELQPDPSVKRSFTKKGLRKLGATPFKATADLTASLAQGLHNAPKLYGDTTVRSPEKITGWQSGLKAAGKELAFGVYDGFTGVVTHPVQGYKEEGRSGLYKGIGKGLGGVLLKPLAGVSGLFGFTFSGLYKEVQKKYGANVDSYLRATRMAQGYTDLATATEEECAEIVDLWQKLHVVRPQRKSGTFRKA